MNNSRKIEKYTVKIKEEKSMLCRETLARMCGVDIFEDTSGKMAKIGGFGMSFAISRVSSGLGE